MNELKHKNAKLLIMGTGPQREELEALVAQYGIQDKVKFLGFVSDEEKPRVLRMADAFVSTSQHEGFGLVFLEAMACGLPVVGYNYGGQTDFLDDQQTGRVVPLGSVRRFTEACASIIDHPAKREQMSAFNLERVEDYFIEACEAGYEDLFQETLDLRAQTQKMPLVPAMN